MGANQSRAAAYIRRSAVSVESPGDASHEAQLAAVRSLCGEDVRVYEDWGISGTAKKTASRPQYLALKAAIEAGEVSSVCAYSLSRLGRSVRELAAFVELCQERGVTVRTKVENVDTSTAMGRFLFTVMAGIAELEAELAAERQGSARAARVARGDDMSAPYGWRLERQADGSLRRVRDASARVDEILDAVRWTGGNIMKACGLLEERGIPAPRGGRRWATSALTRLVEREAPEILPRRAQAHSQRVSVGTFPLGQLVRCPFCDNTLTPMRTRGMVYCRYGARTRDLHPRYVWKAAPILAAVEAEANLYDERLERSDGRAQADESEARRQDLLARRAREVDLRADGGTSRDEARRRIAAIDEELARVARVRIVPVDFSKVETRAYRELFERVDLDPVTFAPTVVWCDRSLRKAD